MKENDTKKKWETPEITVLSVNDDTQGGGNTQADDVLDNS
jgi:hypothetical protein